MGTARRIRYRSPPLVEAVIEFQFVREENWNPAFLDELRTQFPEFSREEPLHVAAVPLSNRPVGMERHHEVRRFWRGDSGMALTVGPQLVAVSALPPKMPEGHQWEHLRDIGLRACDIYMKVSAPRTIRQIGLRYINSVAINPAEFVLETYVDPSSGYIPTSLLGERKPFSFRLERIHSVSKTQVRHEIVALAAEGDPVHGPRVLLDIDEVSVPGHPITLSSKRRIVEEMHNAVQQVFGSVIRAEVLQGFGPEER
ncbi:MAG TPA: TIGR04255 family protein [Longimicrobiaceae bacterium]|nr:TIGR04255 family protein [Longimicrobiaceae bacterium]